MLERNFRFNEIIKKGFNYICDCSHHWWINSLLSESQNKKYNRKANHCYCGTHFPELAFDEKTKQIIITKKYERVIQKYERPRY